MDNNILFNRCINAIQSSPKNADSIGTYGEKFLHKVLKLYFENDTQFHEIAVCGYIADIYDGELITEIQTRGFTAMNKKLSAYFENGKSVRLVFPICRQKQVAWVDKDSAEVSGFRKSPQKGKKYDILSEIYKVRDFFGSKSLQISVVVIDAIDYRWLDGWSKDKKRGSTRLNRVPTQLIEEFTINTADDLREFVPENLQDGFTSNDFARATGLRIDKARCSLTLLTKFDAVARIGKEGNKILYKIMNHQNLGER